MLVLTDLRANGAQPSKRPPLSRPPARRSSRRSHCQFRRTSAPRDGPFGPINPPPACRSARCRRHAHGLWSACSKGARAFNHHLGELRFDQMKVRRAFGAVGQQNPGDLAGIRHDADVGRPANASAVVPESIAISMSAGLAPLWGWTPRGHRLPAKIPLLPAKILARPEPDRAGLCQAQTSAPIGLRPNRRCRQRRNRPGTKCLQT